MWRVGKHTGERAEEAPRRRPRARRIVVLSLATLVTLVAWGVLVFAAIDLGREARSGESTAWTFLVLAGVGAAACLFVALILVGRLVAVLRGREVAPPRPPRVPGRRVAR
jgi:hypothetical protein